MSHYQGIFQRQRGSIWQLPNPDIAVQDPNGRLPLTLQRDKLATALPFVNELRRSCILNLLAELAAWGPTSLSGIGHWSCLREGFTLTNGALLREVGVDAILLRRTFESQIRSQLGAGGYHCIPANSAVVMEISDWMGTHFTEGANELFWMECLAEGVRIRANRPFTDEDFERRAGCIIPPDNWEKLNFIEENKFLFKPRFNLSKLLVEPEMAELYEIFLGSDENLDNSIAETWLEVAGRPLLSWDPEERNEQLQHLLQNEDFLKKVDFYKSIPDDKRPPPLDLSWMKSQ